MKLEDLKLPLEVLWMGHAYTILDSTQPDKVDTIWHPKDTDEDRLIAAEVGTVFYADRDKSLIVELINSGRIVVKE